MEENKTNLPENRKSSIFGWNNFGVAPKQSKDLVLLLFAIYPLIDFILSFITGFINGLFGIQISGRAAFTGLSFATIFIGIADYRTLKRMGYDQLRWYQLVLSPWYMYKKEKMCYGKLFWFYVFIISLVLSMAIEILSPYIISASA